VGLHTRGSRPISLWFTERLATVQKAVDNALPGRTNTLQCGRCESTRYFLVYSRSDTHPGEYLRYDHLEKTLLRLSAARPWLDEAQQARRSFHRVASRDGLSLPVYVTHPRGSTVSDAASANQATRLPAVVIVHGGPWVRGHDLIWDAEAQFLASRGYRVVEVEFRGSTGYGWRHFKAGWKQWGTAMQDDLADAVAWAAREGLIDGSRVCIFGSSYGGYAALMAPLRHPGLFRCAASFAGVTDIGLLYNAEWGDLTEESKRFSLPVLVGDPKVDAPMLDAASPLKRVAELKVPVLLAYGTADRRVPPEHAERFNNAARDAGIKVERVIYHDEGHGFTRSQDHADFLRKLEAFLARALK
jgi:dipeptidyl aminopeptidase/acylaminoacyl peptidase